MRTIGGITPSSAGAASASSSVLGLAELQEALAEALRAADVLRTERNTLREDTIAVLEDNEVLGQRLASAEEAAASLRQQAADASTAHAESVALQQQQLTAAAATVAAAQIEAVAVEEAG